MNADLRGLRMNSENPLPFLVAPFFILFEPNQPWRFAADLPTDQPAVGVPHRGKRAICVPWRLYMKCWLSTFLTTTYGHLRIPRLRQVGLYSKYNNLMIAATPSKRLSSKTPTNTFNVAAAFSLFHFALFRVDAAWPRLGRAFRTAPVSRQTKPKCVWHSPRFHSRLPPSFGLRSIPFTVPPCFFPLPLK